MVWLSLSLLVAALMVVFQCSGFYHLRIFEVGLALAGQYLRF